MPLALSPSKGGQRKEGSPTIPFDLLFMFFAGVAFGVASAAERGLRVGPILGSLGYTFFAALPVAIACYVLAPAWCWMYWVDPARVPLWGAVIVFAAYPALMLLGFFLAARIRGVRSRLRLAAVPLLGIAILSLAFPQRLFTVGSMDDWVNRTTVPLWSSGWTGVVGIGGGLAALAVFVVLARKLAVSTASTSPHPSLQRRGPPPPPLCKGREGGVDAVPVSIVRCGNDIEAALRDSLAAWNGLQHLTQRLPEKGNTMLLKPNIGGGSTFRPGTCTSVEFLLATIRILREAAPAARMVVVESNMIFWRMDRYMPRTPYAATLRNAGVEFLNLSEEPRVPLDLGGWLGVQDVPKILADGAVLIDVPVPKTHAFFRMSGAIKNLFGLLPKQNKIVHYHMLRGGDWDGEIFLDIYRRFPPDLVMVDGIVSGEGHCPLGSAKQTGFILTSPDAFATDLALCQVMGVNPRTVPYLRRLLKAEGPPSMNCERLQPEDVKPATPWHLTHPWSGLPVNVARLLRDHARLYRG